MLLARPYYDSTCWHSRSSGLESPSTLDFVVVVVRVYDLNEGMQSHMQIVVCLL